MNILTPLSFPVLPVPIVAAGENAQKRFVEFFTANIRNINTRRAYIRAVNDFFIWCERCGIKSVENIEPLHVAAWVEELTRRKAAPTVKQQLAAIRMMFDWLVVGQIVPINPAAAVRGPKHVVRKGRTPVLNESEARQLMKSIKTDTVIGLRDRAAIGLMIYTFGRVGAAMSMNVEDVFHQGHKLWVRLHEKGGKSHKMPCQHNLEQYLLEYIEGSGIGNDRKSPLFRSVDRRTKKLGARRLHPAECWHMVRRRARQAGIATEVNNHTFRATGITIYLKNDGQLEKAAQMAAHSSTRTTQLYDRRDDEVSQDEVERIRF